MVIYEEKWCLIMFVKKENTVEPIFVSFTHLDRKYL